MKAVPQAISNRKTPGLLPYEIIKIVETEVESPRFVKACSEAYRIAVKDYIVGKIVKRLASIRDHHGMFEAIEHDDEYGDEVDFSLGASSKLIFRFCPSPVP